jgi:penicillin-binding protein 2A
LQENLGKLNLSLATIIVDENGNQIAKLSVSEGNREYAPIQDIPQLVKDTFVAVEDKRFYEHNGVDLIGIGRALVKDIISFSKKEGASTITQQVARNLFLNADKTLFRKGTEASIALALERRKNKDEILELYLNRIYFGAGQYGIKTAAKYYFNKDITSKDPSQQLEIWEIATLAAIPKAPNTYNPVRNPEKSMDRRAVVLNIMYEQGLITEKERDEAKKAEFDPGKVRKTNQQFPTFVDYVMDEAERITGKSEEELRSGGYTIMTTIDVKAQQAMEEAFKNDKMFEESKDDVPIQGAMVILDQSNGSIRAMVGGRNYESQGWNRVTKPRQPGSSFKPIASYGPALETGNYFPWSILRDDKICYDGGKYCPSDSNSVKYIGPVTMRDAIKESRNQPAVWLLNEIGVKKGVDFARKLGIELDPEKDRNLAIALGGLTNGVSPLEMARAYAAFANGGYLPDVHSILAIKDSKDRVIYEYKEPKKVRVMKPQTAYYVTQILQAVVEPGGTGTRAKISGRVVAGKTGTTQHGIEGLKSSANRDVWFVGYTPELTAAVWMGYDKTDKDHLVRKSSGQAAAMFSAVMSKALEGKPKKLFPKPEGIPEQSPMPEITGLSGVYSPESVSVDLTWTVNEMKEGMAYKVYRKQESDAGFMLLAETAETAFSDYAILPDQVYTYYVTVYDPQAKQESKPSPQVTVAVDSSLNLPVMPPSDSDSMNEGGWENGGPGDDGFGHEEGEPGYKGPGDAPSDESETHDGGGIFPSPDVTPLPEETLPLLPPVQQPAQDLPLIPPAQQQEFNRP